MATPFVAYSALPARLLFLAAAVVSRGKLRADLIGLGRAEISEQREGSLPVMAARAAAMPPLAGLWPAAWAGPPMASAPMRNAGARR
jgi:hypothetical protein